MINRVEEYVKLHNMFEKGDTLIVGVSGGADSVCLLSVLWKLKDKWDINLICAHVNHMFRDTAVRDEEYVEALCNRLGICCRVKRENVQKISEREGISFEEAGRKVRYDFFRELKEEFGAVGIAVAHNKDDCAETALFHLFRGSHIKGLGGIRPVTQDIIRPLLNMQRNEIEEYLYANHIEWKNDETNASTEYTRNYIRHEILPAAEKICPGAKRRIAETAISLQETEDYLESQTLSAWAKYCRKQDGGTFIDGKLLLREHPMMVSRLLYYVLEQESQTARDLTKVHIREITALFSLQTGRQISLPAKVYAHKTAEGVFIRKEESETKTWNYLEPAEEIPEPVKDLVLDKELLTGRDIRREAEGLGCIKAKLLFDFDLKNIPQKTYTKWFDYDKITECAVFRKRMEGDFLTIDEKGSHKKLKEYFIQEKIPAYKRNEVWVLADDNHIMWIPGYRISSYYKVNEYTERVLEITIGGKENE